MRILICDDDSLIIDQIQKYIKLYFDKTNAKCPELVSFSDGESLLADKVDKDIVFLDIHAYLTKRKYSAFKDAYLLYLESTR